MCGSLATIHGAITTMCGSPAAGNCRPTQRQYGLLHVGSAKAAVIVSTKVTGDNSRRFSRARINDRAFFCRFAEVMLTTGSFYSQRTFMRERSPSLHACK